MPLCEISKNNAVGYILYIVTPNNIIHVSYYLSNTSIKKAINI